MARPVQAFHDGTRDSFTTACLLESQILPPESVGSPLYCVDFIHVQTASSELMGHVRTDYRRRGAEQEDQEFLEEIEPFKENLGELITRRMSTEHICSSGKH